MKKTYKLLITIAAAAVALSSCQKSEVVGNDENRLVVHASEEMTKTHLDSDYNVIWDADEDMYIFCMESSGKAPVSAVSDKATFSNENKEADFSFTLSGTGAFSNFIYGGVYPSSAVSKAGNDKNANAGAYKIELPNVQTPQPDAYDPEAFIMIAKPQTFQSAQTEISQYFRKAVALNDITFKNCGLKDEKVSLIKITLPEGKYLAGRRNIDLTTGDLAGYTSTAYSFNSITLNYSTPFSVSEGKVGAWFTSWGVEFSEGTMSVEIETDKAVYKRDITVSKSISFVEGKYNILTIDMSSAARTAKSDSPDYSGEWLIVNEGKTYAAQKYVSKENNLDALSISVNEDSSIDEVEGIEDCKMVIKKVDDGDYAGLYTIQDAAGLYLYAAGSTKNYLKGGATCSVDSYWKIEKTENNGLESWSITASKSSNRNVMQYNSGSQCFSCYSSASQDPIALVSYSKVKVDLTPVLSVGDIANVPAAGVTGATVQITVKNINSVRATPDGTVVTSASVTGNTLTYTVSENTSSEVREGQITLSAAGVDDVIVKVNQKAAGAVVSKTGAVKFGTNNVKVDKATVTSTDVAGTSWTITTVGTTSFTQNTSYSQIGSSSKPATSITVVGKNEKAQKIESVSVKFGGFSGTAGTVTIKVGDTQIGAGKLNATSDVTVASTSAADGNTITISVTGISKGVKLYSIDYKYLAAE